MTLILTATTTARITAHHRLSPLTSLPPRLSHRPKHSQLRFSSSKFAVFQQLNSDDDQIESAADSTKLKKRLSEQSSWEAKDSKGNDYLYRLGAEADNMNIAVGARSGVIDDLFTGNFLGRDSDIVFDYRQKVTRSFQHLQGDYYIAPLFLVTEVETSLNVKSTKWN